VSKNKLQRTLSGRSCCKIDSEEAQLAGDCEKLDDRIVTEVLELIPKILENDEIISSSKHGTVTSEVESVVNIVFLLYSFREISRKVILGMNSRLFLHHLKK
jgi:hypothetical protein